MATKTKKSEPEAKDEPKGRDGETDGLTLTPEEAEVEHAAEADDLLPATMAQHEVVRFDDKGRELIARTVMPGATDLELSLFERVCLRTQLDPFARQIYAVKRRVKEDNSWIDKWTFQTSIDGFRLIAQRSHEYAGQTAPEWYDGKQWTDVWLSDDPPKAARVGVYRTSFREALMRTVTWADFGPKDISKAPMWRNMGAFMLAKCAESQALRAAFPQELSGIYTSEEMAQQIDEGDWADAGARPSRVEGPPPTAVPTSWPQIEALVEAADPGGYVTFTAFAKAAAEHLFGEENFAALDRGQQLVMGQKAAGAAVHLAESHPGPGFMPPISTENYQNAWAAVLDGTVLEIDHDLTPEGAAEARIEQEADEQEADEQEPEAPLEAAGASETPSEPEPGSEVAEALKRAQDAAKGADSTESEAEPEQGELPT